MRVSIIHSICIKHDAISDAIRNEISWLLSAPGNEVRLFAFACDHQDIPYTNVCGLSDVLFDPFFRLSDVVIFHFGVYYPLFDALFIVPNGAKSVVVFHNITPKEYLPPSDHEIIDKSFNQVSNIVFADHIVCVSFTNKASLASLGINVASASVLPLSLTAVEDPPQHKPSFHDRILRLLFVGRFVQSKGPVDLLVAASNVLQARFDINVQIDFVANLAFSDPELVSEIRSLSDALLAEYGQRLTIGIHGNAPESLKRSLFAAADIFVLPTRHEGFCVPILEAYQGGCCVVSYLNSNVVDISGGFARLVSTCDVHLLAQAISEVADLVQSDEWRMGGGYLEYRENVLAYCQRFDPQRARSRFLNYLDDVARGSRPSAL